MKFKLPTPHGDKLKALLYNEKLPPNDVPRVELIIDYYNEWLKELSSIEGSFKEIIMKMVSSLNKYKLKVELDLIFDSPDDFLYRQKGQLKLESSVLEEFLPWLVAKALHENLKEFNLILGPSTCFSGIRFESSISDNKIGGGMKIKEKDHDFTIAKKIYLKTSYQSDFKESIISETNIAYVVAECKTNLDKTMFQEANATAFDLKTTVPGAKYYLLCEWLDMTPINTSITAIDEVLILRKAKRIQSHIREKFNKYEGRKENREYFINYISEHQFSPDVFERFLLHILNILSSKSEEDILSNGYF